MFMRGEGDAAARVTERRREVIRVSEAQPPVAEIARYDEDVVLVRQVGSEEVAVPAFRGRGSGAHEYGHERREVCFRGEVSGEQVVDVGEVHLEAVLCFVGVKGERGELLGEAEGGEDVGVEAERAEGGEVVGAFWSGESAVGQVQVVGGAEEEDAFAVLAVGG